MAKNWFLIAVCLLLIPRSPKCFADDPNAQAEALYASGNQLEEAKKYDDAKVAYQQVLQQYPNSPFAAGATLHLSRFNVLSLIAAGNQNAADAEIATITASYSNHPDFPWYLYGIANKYEELKRNDQAKPIYQTIVQQYPNSPVIGGATLHLSRFNTQAMIIDGNQAAADAEIKAMTTNWPNHPDLPMYLNIVGKQYETLHRDDEAKIYYQKVVQQFPNSPSAKSARIHLSRYNVESLIASGNMTAAQSEIDGIKAAFPNHPDLAWYLNAAASQYEQSERYQEAKGIYQQTTTQFPDTVVVPGTQVGYTGYAQLQAAKLDIFKLIEDANTQGADAAITKLKADFADHPMLTNALLIIAERYYAYGAKLHVEQETANKELHAATTILENDVLGKISDKDDNASAYYTLGLSYQKLGDSAKATPAFERAYQIDPKGRYAGAVALCYEKLKAAGDVNSVEADAVIEKSYLSIYKDNPYCDNADCAAIKLGQINMKRGNWHEAISYFEKGFEKSPADSKPANVLYALARMYEKTENKPKALEIYQQLLLVLEDGSPEIQKVKVRIVAIEEQAGE